MDNADYWQHLLRLRNEQRRVKRDLERARRAFAATMRLMDAAQGYKMQAGWILN